MADVKKTPKQADPKKPVTKTVEEPKEKKIDEKKNKADDKVQKKEEPKETKAITAKSDNKDNKEKSNKDKKDTKTTDEKKDIKTTTDEKKETKQTPKDKKDDKESSPSNNKKEEPKVSEKSPEEIENGKMPAYQIGDEVVLTKDRMGVIRYKGRVAELGSSIFYGVELTDGSVGHNDGQVKGVRYFKTDGQRAMFVGHEKIRRKMTKRDHKRIDSFHAVASDLQKKHKEGDVNSSSQESPKEAGPSQDDEKEPVLSPTEVHRQRQESLAQRDENNSDNNNNNNNNNNYNNAHKESISGDGLQPAFRTENLLQFIIRQNNKYRDILLDTFASPQTHTIIVEAFNGLKEMENEEQVYAWSQLISRWQKYL